MRKVNIDLTVGSWQTYTVSDKCTFFFQHETRYVEGVWQHADVWSHPYLTSVWHQAII